MEQITDVHILNASKIILGKTVMQKKKKNQSQC